MKKKPGKDTLEYEIREDNLEGEIIDLGDLAEEYLETIETNINLSGVVGDELDDTLDEELVGIDAKNSEGSPTSKNETNPDLEKSLLELFESSESAAAKLIEREFQKEEPTGESPEAGDHATGGGVAHSKPGAQATNEKDRTGDIPEPKTELHRNLFLNLEVVKEKPSRESRANRGSPLDGEPMVVSNKTRWIDSGRYYPESVHAIDKKIAEYEQEIAKLLDKKRKIKRTYEQLRGILYLEGQELKKAVAIILSKYWTLKLTFMNKTKRPGFSDNILIKYNNKIVIAKIKGTHTAYPSHKFITQVWQDLHYSGLGTRADGALIVNHDIEIDPKDRSAPYADEDADQLDDLILIDTRVLHKLTTAIIDGDLSVEEGRKILFKKGRVEFWGSGSGHPTSPDNS